MNITWHKVKGDEAAPSRYQARNEAGTVITTVERRLNIRSGYWDNWKAGKRYFSTLGDAKRYVEERERAKAGES